jgi:hypothetical protein
MPVTTLLVVAGNLLFVLACGTVGARLLRLSRRTQKMPELLLGIGLLFVVIAIPVLGASGIGRGTVGELRVPLVLLGLSLLTISVVSQAAFAFKTFRPGQNWALAIVVLIGLAELSVSTTVMSSILTSAPDLPAILATKDGVQWVRAPFTIAYAWTAIEALLQYRMARRREQLGIGNAVVTNRFLLWGATGVFACTNTLITTALHYNGMTPFNHPLGAACFGLGSVLTSVTLTLAFIPPARYRRWVEQRSVETPA